jgi:hypothetical protein
VELTWKIGVEVELVAPRGASRRDLAEALARSRGASVRPFFHPQSELSLVPDLPVFENLTLGFEVIDDQGLPAARYVDDLTLQDDLEPTAAPKPGWYRVVSDDTRFLALVRRLGRADGTPLDAVAPVARLFGTEPEVFDDGTIRVTDDTLAPIVIAMALPGERERPCEIVTAPLTKDHGKELERLLGPAREHGFRIARESATHVHFDGAPLCSPRVFRALVLTLEHWGPMLKALVSTNPACRRLGAWPEALLASVEAPDFVALPWSEARARLSEVGLTKYCDFNLRNLVHDITGKHTFEVRVLPGMIETETILEHAALFEGILRACVEEGAPCGLDLESMASLLDRLPLAPDVRRHWRAKAEGG